MSISTSTTFTVEQETEAGYRKAEFTIDFKCSAFVPAQTYGDPDSCHDAEGGEIENMKITLDSLTDENEMPIEVTPEIEKNLVAWLEANREDEINEKCMEAAQDYEYDPD